MVLMKYPYLHVSIHFFQCISTRVKSQSKGFCRAHNITHYIKTIYIMF